MSAPPAYYKVLVQGIRHNTEVNHVFVPIAINPFQEIRICGIQPACPVFQIIQKRQFCFRLTRWVERVQRIFIHTCPFSTHPITGYAALDDYYDEDEEDEYDPDDYPDCNDDDTPPAFVIVPRPSDDLDDLPF